jgi:hypothetical protein
MSIPRDHHFIPAFFLEQWAGPDGKLVEYTIKHGKLIAKPVGANATGYERDLYAFPELPSDMAQHIEQVFWDYADRTASEALKLQLAGGQAGWTPELVSGWSRFLIGIHTRHPDAVPELRAAAKSIWIGSGKQSQAEYELIKSPNDPPTFDEYLALRDPLTPIKMHVNQIIKVFDNDVVGTQINKMHWSILDLSAVPNRLLLSDRPVAMYLINKPEGRLSMPISPTKLFFATNDLGILNQLRKRTPKKLVSDSNALIVSRARRFVWSQDRSQVRFIGNRMSTEMEPTPLFPGVGYYPTN